MAATPSPRTVVVGRRAALTFGGGALLAGVLDGVSDAAATPCAPGDRVERELDAVAAEFWRRVQARELSASALFVPGPALLVGSDAGEVHLGRDAIEAHLRHYYALPERLSYETRRRQSSASGAAAWLWTEGVLLQTPPQGAPTATDYRIAYVFARTGTAWRIQLFSGSEPAHPSDAPGPGGG